MLLYILTGIFCGFIELMLCHSRCQQQNIKCAKFERPCQIVYIKSKTESIFDGAHFIGTDKPKSKCQLHVKLIILICGGFMAE